MVGDIEIDRDGSVREYTVSSKLAPALQRVVEKHVREWAFEPIAVDGNPVIATTAVRLQLRAVPTADDYRLQVESVSFGEARAGKTLPPRYPAAAVSAGIGARVLLQAKLDPQGRVVAVHPYQTSLSGPESDRWLPIFWSLDYFKESQAEEKKKTGWTLPPVDESKVPAADKARQAFVEAIEKWDVEGVDGPAVALARTGTAKDVFELFYRHSLRDFRDIGHKAI